MTFADQVLSFYRDLEIKAPLPEGVVALNPYRDDESFSYCTKFYKKFFDDGDERTVILGINPGRHGGGITGIPFTDPVKLDQCCHIPNSLEKTRAFGRLHLYDDSSVWWSRKVLP